MDKPHVYFGLLVTTLREHPRLDGLDDHEVADLIASALCAMDPSGRTEQIAANYLCGAFAGIASALRINAEEAKASIEDDMPEPTTEQLSDLAHLVPDRYVEDYHPAPVVVAPGFVEAEVLPEYKHVIP